MDGAYRGFDVVRYLFRGLMRDTGLPVEGHVEAASDPEAYDLLSAEGIVTESVRPDPKVASVSPPPVSRPEFGEAIDSALDTATMQVAFDDLTELYRGKKVRIVDREKIRRRVAQVVDQALARSLQEAQNSSEVRQQVAEAIQGMFGDARNLTSEAAGPNPVLESQIARLAGVVRQAEGVLTALNVAIRRLSIGGGGGGGVRRRYVGPDSGNEEQSAVLLEIFKHNLELVRTLEGVSASASSAPAPAPAPAGGT